LDSSITFPYCLDQEFVTDPVSKSYFSLFLRLIALASGEKRPFLLTTCCLPETNPC